MRPVAEVEVHQTPPGRDGRRRVDQPLVVVPHYREVLDRQRVGAPSVRWGTRARRRADVGAAATPPVLVVFRLLSTVMLLTIMIRLRSPSRLMPIQGEESRGIARPEVIDPTYRREPTYIQRSRRRHNGPKPVIFPEQDRQDMAQFLDIVVSRGGIEPGRTDHNLHRSGKRDRQRSPTRRKFRSSGLDATRM